MNSMTKYNGSNVALRSPFDDIFDGFFSKTPFYHYEKKSVFYDEKVTDDQIQICMPGTRKEDVDVSLAGRRLTVSWKDWHERQLTRSYDLSADVEEPKVKLADGILTVSLTSAEKRKIAIE